MRLKNAPHPIPLITMKTDNTAMELAKGQMTRELRPAKRRDRTRLFNGPNLVSAKNPPPTRPTVEATFQNARMMIATRWEATTRAKIGMKYDGTNSGKQPSPLPMNRTRNFFSLNRYLEFVDDG